MRYSLLLPALLLTALLVGTVPVLTQADEVQIIPVDSWGFHFRLSPDGTTAALYEEGLLHQGEIKRVHFRLLAKCVMVLTDTQKRVPTQNMRAAAGRDGLLPVRQEIPMPKY